MRWDAPVRLAEPPGLAVNQRIAQTLTLRDGDIGPILARTLEQTQADRVKADHE